MNREDIIRMAEKAGFMLVAEREPETGGWYECFDDEIDRFAALVAAAEREACAKVCEKWANSLSGEPEMLEMAAEIRARGQQ